MDREISRDKYRISNREIIEKKSNKTNTFKESITKINYLPSDKEWKSRQII